MEGEDEGQFSQGCSELSHSLWGGQLGAHHLLYLTPARTQLWTFVKMSILSEGKAGAGILSWTSGWLALSCP